MSKLVVPSGPDSYGADFDSDIAAIFGEEATELLEQSEAALSRWREDRADRAPLRSFRTWLKGEIG